MGEHKKLKVLGLTLVISAYSCAHAAPKLGIGHEISDQALRAWNIDIAPDGKGLPEGSGDIKTGEKVYTAKCMACHGANLEGGLGPALVGGSGTLKSSKPVKTVGSYWPYATTLFDYIRRAMPFQQPQSLSDTEVYSVTSYILFKNNIITDNIQLDAKTLVSIKMPNRDAFYVDDRPDTNATLCYQNCR